MATTIMKYLSIILILDNLIMPALLQQITKVQQPTSHNIPNHFQATHIMGHPPKDIEDSIIDSMKT